jgi:hypothetical protein
MENTEDRTGLIEKVEAKSWIYKEEK